MNPKIKGGIEMGLTLNQVKKHYGNKTVVDNLSLQMNQPRCFWITSEPMAQEKPPLLE